MARVDAQRSERSDNRIVFLTRDPVVHQRGGSTTYALGLLELLQAQGADVTLVATTAYSRSPRLFFRVLESPRHVALRFPGYLRVGGIYVCPQRWKAWARMLARLAVRRPWLRGFSAVWERVFGGGLYAGAWDLTVPTPEEGEVALAEVEEADASVVIANYCIWGPLMEDGRLGQRRTAILMHDLLSARVRRFVEAGLPLDSPAITEDEEIRWLSAAQTVLAAQEREAGVIRERVGARVVVTPMVLTPRSLGEERVVAGRCLFVGSNIPPNQTGLQFLLEAVWPRVRAEVPGAVLAVAGSVGDSLGDAGVRLEALGVERMGVVASLEEEYARAAVCVVPLVIGTGIKIKLVEALGFGKAVVSTSVGVQGMEGWASQAIEVADDGETFAAAIVRLLSDEGLRREREAAALRLAEEQFGVGRELDPEFVRAVL